MARIQPRKIVRRSPFLEGRTDTHCIYEGLTAFADFAKTVTTEGRIGSCVEFNTSGSFQGGITGYEAHRLALIGDNSKVSMSDQLLMKLEDVAPSRNKYQWQESVAGARVDIGRYLAGHPLNMKMRRRVPMEDAPINIVVENSYSAATKERQIAMRGAAILALVRSVSALRPVTLYIMMGMNDGQNASWHYVPVDTQPLDLARLSFVLQHPAFFRHLGFAAAAIVGGYSGEWPYRAQARHRSAFPQIVDGILPEGELFYISPAYSEDQEQALLDSKPEAWLRKMVTKYTGDDESAGHSWQAA